MPIFSRASVRINGTKYATVGSSTEYTYSGVERTRQMNDDGSSAGSTESPKSGMVKFEIAAEEGFRPGEIYNLTDARIIIEGEGAARYVSCRGCDCKAPPSWKSGEGKYAFEFDCRVVVDA